MTEQQPDNQIEEAAETQPTSSLGTTLREARERMGLSVSDVVNRLKFAPRQVKALEEDDFEQLPEPAFLRGFVRSYARLLQLDEAALLAALPGPVTPQTEPVARQSVEVPFPGVYSLRKSNILWLVAALVVALVLGLFTWLRSEQVPETPMKSTVVQPAQEVAPEQLQPAAAVEAKDETPAPPTPAPAVATEPVAQKPAAPVAPVKHKAAATGPGMIHLVFVEDSWVEIKDKDDQVLLSLLGTGGSEQDVDGTPPFAVTVGHASGVQLYYKGKQVDMVPYTRAEVAHLTLE